MAEITVDATDDPAEALGRAGTYLAKRPVEHNVALSILSLAVADRDPGRYWTAARRGEVVGFAMQYPRTYRVALTPMWPDVVAPLAGAIAAEAQGARIPGVVAEAGTAAAFAGCWSELAQVPIAVDDGQRLYRLGRLRLPSGVPGRLRRATTADARLLDSWWEAFSEETGSYVGHAAVAVERGIAAGRVFVWDDRGPVCTARATAGFAGVSRIGMVYTPPERRGRGYGSALVGRLCAWVEAEEALACILYAQLGNPTSNAIYRRLGFEAVAEVLSYRFG